MAEEQSEDLWIKAISGNGIGGQPLPQRTVRWVDQQRPAKRQHGAHYAGGGNTGHSPQFLRSRTNRTRPASATTPSAIQTLAIMANRPSLAMPVPHSISG